MSEDTGTSVRLVREYLREMDEALLGSPDEAEVLARVRGLPGGIEGAITMIGIGLPAAFRPDLAAGEVGTVAFILDADGKRLELHVELAPDRCRVVAPAGQPTTIIQMPAGTFLKVAFKQADGNDAYLDGLVEVEGDIVLAASFGEWFERPHGGMVTRVQELGLTGELPPWLAGGGCQPT
jgi:SCP-2 sterol transfer family